MVESGISVAIDVERLGERIAERVAHRLAALFPNDPTDFWVALVEQAAIERERAAVPSSPLCTCPATTTSNAFTGIILDGPDDEGHDDGNDQERDDGYYAGHGEQRSDEDGPTDESDDGDPATAPLDPDPRYESADPLGRG